MQHAKTGLRLLAFSIFVTIAWIVVGAIIQVIYDTTKSASTIDIAFISSCVAAGCYIIELIGLHIAGKDNSHFRFASFLKIASLLLAITCVILGAVSQNMSADAKNTIGIVGNVVNIIISVADVIALISIVKGCKEIAPRVKGQANLILVCFIIMTASIIALSFIKVDNNTGLLVLSILLIIAVLVASIIYAINYIILIFRTASNVGKPR